MTFQGFSPTHDFFDYTGALKSKTIGPSRLGVRRISEKTESVKERMQPSIHQRSRASHLILCLKLPRHELEQNATIFAEKPDAPALGSHRSNRNIMCCR